MGRTQLQDAVPMTLGQEFKTYATMIDDDINRLSKSSRTSKRGKSWGNSYWNWNKYKTRVSKTCN